MDKLKRNCPNYERNQNPKANPFAAVHEKRKKCSEAAVFFKKTIVKQFASECEQMRRSGCVQWICFMWKARKEMGIAGKYGEKRPDGWNRDRMLCSCPCLLRFYLDAIFMLTELRQRVGFSKALWGIKCILLAWFIFTPLKMSLKKTPSLHVTLWLST